MIDRPGRNEGSESGERFERIVPMVIGAAARAAPTATPASASPLATPTAARWLLPTAFATLIAMVVVLAAALWLRPPQPPAAAAAPDRALATAAASAPPAPAAPAAAVAAADVEAALQQRQQAQALGAEVQAARARLDAMRVAQWGVAQFAQLTTQTAQGEAYFAARDFTAAAQDYRAALTSAQALQARSSEVLQQALADGRQALVAGNAVAAQQAFALARAIAPEHAEAGKGAQRAAVLDALRAQLHNAHTQEAAGQLDAALAAFRQALRMDADAADARAGVTRVAAALAERSFRSQMSLGLAALDREDFPAAQSAFQSALQQRPAAAAAVDGLARAQLGQQRQSIGQQRERAIQAENTEQWTEAEDAYTAVLALDNTLTFARQGRDHAATRSELDARLQAHIARPERLSSENVRADAEHVLAQAAAIDGSGPRLRSQMQLLGAQVKLANTLVDVTLQSDGGTDVLLNGVGELGRFKTKTLHLRPGTYTLIGRRDGYRDGSETFTVTAKGADSEPVIRCGERI